MYWATHSRPIPLTELGWINTSFLASGSSQCDPMLIWGTTVETEPLEAFLAEQRGATGMIISGAHVLVRAVAQSLHRHPEMNRRVFGRRVYQYNGVNITMPMLQTRSGEVECVFLHEAEKLSLRQIAERLWEEARQKAVHMAAEKRRCRERSSLWNKCIDLGRRLSLEGIHLGCRLAFAVGNRWRFPTVWHWQQELNGAGAFVNFLGFPDAPPLVAHKPASLPMNAYSVAVTMGRAEAWANWRECASIECANVARVNRWHAGIDRFHETPRPLGHLCGVAPGLDPLGSPGGTPARSADILRATNDDTNRTTIHRY